MPSDKALHRKKEMLLSNPDYPEDTYYIYYLRDTRLRGFHGVYPDVLVDISELARRKMEYVIVSNMLGRKDHREFMDELRKRAELVKSFSPYLPGVDRVRPAENTGLPAAAFSAREIRDRRSFGPYIEIYKVKAASGGELNRGKGRECREHSIFGRGTGL